MPLTVLRRLDCVLAPTKEKVLDTLFKDRDEFERVLDDTVKESGLKLAAPVRKAILSALSERDETAAICRDADGNPEPDPELRDTESVPLLPATIR